MKILLLGTTGLLGHNVLRQLLFDGHTVRTLVRNPDKVLIRDERIEIVKGSLDTPTLTAAAHGCDAIVNCAGVTDMGLLRYEDYTDINTELPNRLTYVMKHHGISTLVHVSTANTIGYGSPEKEADETCPIQAPFDKSYYALSKQAGEQHLMQAAKDHPDWHIVIVNPGFIIGDYDIKPSSGTLLLTGYRKPLMAAPNGGKSFVAAKDAAVAIANALTLGRNGERYLLTADNMTLRAFYKLQSATMGYRQLLISLPDWLVSLAGALGDLVRMMGIKTQLSTRNVRQLMVREYYDSTKARTELKLPHTPLDQTIRTFFEWWGNNQKKQTL